MLLCGGVGDHACEDACVTIDAYRTKEDMLASNALRTRTHSSISGTRNQNTRVPKQMAHSMHKTLDKFQGENSESEFRVTAGCA